jgi:hypothetical protein
MGVQISDTGLYLAPELKCIAALLLPPQTIISLPVQTAVCWYRADGALSMVVGDQVSVNGS